MNQILKKLIILCFSFCTFAILASASESSRTSSQFKKGETVKVKIIGGDKTTRINGSFQSIFKTDLFNDDLINKYPLIFFGYAIQILSLKKVQECPGESLVKAMNAHPLGNTKDIFHVYIDSVPYLVHKSWMKRVEEVKS